MTSEADVGGASATGGEGEVRTSRRARYLHEIQFVLVASLVLVSAATGIAAWHLHPASSGFPAIPQDLRIVTSGSNFNMTQTLTPTADEGATLQVDEPFDGATTDEKQPRPLRHRGVTEAIRLPATRPRRWSSVRR